MLQGASRPALSSLGRVVLEVVHEGNRMREPDELQVFSAFCGQSCSSCLSLNSRGFGSN